MKGKPSALSMPKDKKQKAVNAVFDAVGILNKRMRKLRDLEGEICADVRSFIGVHKFNMHLSDAFIALFSGRSHQRHLRRRERQWDVRIESLKIARETGVPIEEVEEAFLSMVSRYVKPRE